jgi:hypothetical protein
VKEMLKRGKLTKRFLMKLSSGAYITSSVFFKKDVSVYAVWVISLHLREIQWKVIVDLAVDQRLCYVFENMDADEKWQVGISLIEK